jgi:hypothetical protein
MPRSKPIIVFAVIAACLWLRGSKSFAAEEKPTVLVAGHVLRHGVFRIEGDKPTVLTAIDWASAEDDTQDFEIVITRRINKKLTETIKFNSLRELRAAPDAAPALRAGDQIMLKKPEPEKPKDGL